MLTPRRAWTLAASGLVLFLFCSPTSDHYWDEYFYVFSASQHSPATLLAMEAMLSDGIFPNGFFSGKLGFVVMLHGLLAVTGTGAAGLMMVRGLFAGVTIALAVASWLLLRELVDDRRTASQAAVIVLVLPLSLYLGFKVLAEVPSLLAATLAGWQLARAVRAAAGSSRRTAVAIAGAGFALGIVMRLTSGLFAAGLLGALLVVRPGGASLRQIVVTGSSALGLAAVLTIGVYAAVLGHPLERFEGLATSVTSRTPGTAVAVYAVAIFMQLFAALAAVALWPPVTRAVKGALLWLAIAMLPYLVSAQYIEPRFFYTALVPLALLASAGLDRLTAVLPRRTPRATPVGTLAAIVVVNRLAFAPLMPYELREADYSALVQDVRSQATDATLVTPWLSDFCYLATAFPGQRVVLAMSESYGSGEVFDSPQFRRWVGAGRYVSSGDDLGVLPPPWVYVGWEFSPTVIALDRYLRPFGLARLDDPASRAGMLNHLTPSWLWTDPEHRLEPLAQRGAYRAFTIKSAPGG